LNPALTLALNQSGKVLVGWFASPPAFVPNIADTVSRVGDENKFKMQGVLVANLEDQGPRGIPFNWIRSGQYRPFNELDPDDLLLRIANDPSDRTIRAGLMQFVEQSAGKPFQELLVRFDNSQRTFDRFVRVKQSARWPVADIDFLPPAVRDWMIGEQIDPVPSTYIDEIRARVGVIGDPPRLPPMAKLLEEWARGDETVKKIKREQMANEIDDPAFSSPHHAVAVGVRLRAQAAASTITLNGITQTYLEWYRDVLADEENVIARTPGFVSIVKPKFARAGIEVAGQFAYTLTFTKLGGSIPVVKVGAYGFVVAIKREKLEYARDSSKQLVLGADGKPVIKSRTVQYDTSKGGLGKYLGLFFDIGLGIGFSKSGTGVSGGGALGDVTFISSADVQPQDFDQARFTMTALKAPGVSVGNFVSFDTFTSKYVELVLVKKPAVLTSIDTKSFQFSPPKVPSASDLKDPAKYLKKWFEAKLDGKVVDLSEGWGMIVLQIGAPSARPSPDAPPVLTPTEMSRLVKRQIQAFFDVDSAIVRPSARRQFEAVLALDRALIDASSVTLTAWGYASPERDVSYNLRLSQARAEAVIQAVRDAFGTKLVVTSTRAIGLGEEPSEREGHLHDPEASGVPLSQFIKQHPDEVKQWPQWRRVDLEIAGRVLTQVFVQPTTP
jgi:outer membrane protein OmpA-like peptidoglycan-associated protein